MLERFLDAQKFTYEEALREIQTGRKRTHWIWYIFPQLKGLGYSYNATLYGINDIQEAKEYIAHPVLRHRLIEISQALLDLKALTAEEIFGYVDAMKVRSSMTLFRAADPEITVFDAVLKKYYKDQPDRQTERMLGIENNGSDCM